MSEGTQPWRAPGKGISLPKYLRIVFFQLIKTFLLMAIPFQTNLGMFPFELISRFRNSILQKVRHERICRQQSVEPSALSNGQNRVSRELWTHFGTQPIRPLWLGHEGPERILTEVLLRGSQPISFDGWHCPLCSRSNSLGLPTV